MSEKKDNSMNVENYLNTVEQGRAVFAYERVVDTVNEPKNKAWLSEYKSYLKKIPMLIKTNGLGATFAFIFSKKEKKKAYGRIYQDCSKWLREDPKKIFKLPEKAQLMNYIITLNSSEYRSLTNEIIALIKWMARFADGFITD